MRSREPSGIFFSVILLRLLAHLLDCTPSVCVYFTNVEVRNYVSRECVCEKYKWDCSCLAKLMILC